MLEAKNKYFYKNVQISKYRLLWFQIPVSCYFFLSLQIPSSVDNTVSRPYFSQNLNLKIFYWKSSFLVHQQILPPTPLSPWLLLCQNTIFKFQIQFQQSQYYWMKNSMSSLILWLKKQAIVFYSCLCIVACWIPWKWHMCHLNVCTTKPSKIVGLTCKENISTENWDERRGKISYRGPYTWWWNWNFYYPLVLKW